jgi:hypothetical protein
VDLGLFADAGILTHGAERAKEPRAKSQTFLALCSILFALRFSLYALEDCPGVSETE